MKPDPVALVMFGSLRIAPVAVSITATNGKKGSFWNGAVYEERLFTVGESAACGLPIPATLIVAM